MQNFSTLPIELRELIYSYGDLSMLYALFFAGESKKDLNVFQRDLSDFKTLCYILKAWYPKEHFSSKYFEECKKILEHKTEDAIFEAFISICKQHDIAMQEARDNESDRERARKMTIDLKNACAKSAIAIQLLFVSLARSNSFIREKIKAYETGHFFLVLNLSKKFEETCFYSLRTTGILELLKQSKTGIRYYINAIILPFPRACKFALDDPKISKIIAQNTPEKLAEIKCKAEEVCDATDRPTVHV